MTMALRRKDRPSWASSRDRLVGGRARSVTPSEAVPRQYAQPATPASTARRPRRMR
ncbi:MAG: hypothetical protein U0797_30010 [Gemmataceae bacterium]